MPVTFPPGRARLATMPSRTGSWLIAITMGIVPVAFLAATAAEEPRVTMTSGLSAAAYVKPDPHPPPPGLGRADTVCASYAYAVFRRARSGTKWISIRRLSAALIRWSILSECPA